MNLVFFLKLIRKHLVLLVATPVLLAGLVAFFTRHPDFRYSSETRLFTGIMTGSSVELDKTLNYFATNTSYDNLINIVKSRQTQQEVAVRLLAQHLLLKEADPKLISAVSFRRLKQITPAYVSKLVENSLSEPAESVSAADSLLPGSVIEVKTQPPVYLLPPGTGREAYENTVKALTRLMNSSDTNFVYRILNFDDPHYSIAAISTVNVQRIGTSDMVQLKYETNDPGICQQTLAMLIDVCVHNYKSIRANQSDAVVRYFEDQLKSAAEKLGAAEEKLLDFNKDNNIINYNEQSRGVAMSKEALDAEYNAQLIKLAGIEAVIKNLELKLGNQEEMALKSRELLSKKDQMGDLAYRIATAEAHVADSGKDIKVLAELKSKESALEEEMRSQVGDYYRIWNSAEGLPVATLLSDWIDNVIAAENTKAGLKVLEERIAEYGKQYEIFAPAGANVKRIEREISVSEGEYLEILHGLNLARLKLQDNEMTSNIKTVDAPYFPLSPIKTKRKLLVLIGAMAGFFTILALILFLEYFDKTLKNPEKAAAILRMKMAGLLPRILRKGEKVNLPFIINRLLEITLQNTGTWTSEPGSEREPVTILLMSTNSGEGKTMVAGNIARKLRRQGEKVLFMKYSGDSLSEAEKSHIGYVEVPPAGSDNANRKRRTALPVLRMLLGYGDNRIDYESPFLELPQNYLGEDEYTEYQLGEKYRTASTYSDLPVTGLPVLKEKTGFILIELPPLLFYPAPAALVASAGVTLLVCRSNREWCIADEGAMENLRKLADGKLMFFLNGVDLPAVEQVLGDLPKKRSRFRRMVKKLVRFQFFSDSQI